MFQPGEDASLVVAIRTRAVAGRAGGVASVDHPIERRMEPPVSKAFITGSRCYGTPRDDSDLDLVILASNHAFKMLAAFADDDSETGEGSGKGTPSSGSFRFGKLNIIAITDESVFEVWRAATESLKAKAPVSRDDAVELIKGMTDALFSEAT